MIIQINWSQTPQDRHYGNTLYIHYGAGCPNNDEIQKFLTKYFGFPEDYITLEEDYLRDLNMYMENRLVGTAWPVFCSYKDGKITNPEFQELNDNKSMQIRARPAV